MIPEKYPCRNCGQRRELSSQVVMIARFLEIPFDSTWCWGSQSTTHIPVWEFRKDQATFIGFYWSLKIRCVGAIQLIIIEDSKAEQIWRKTSKFNHYHDGHFKNFAPWNRLENAQEFKQQIKDVKKSTWKAEKFNREFFLFSASSRVDVSSFVVFFIH